MDKVFGFSEKSLSSSLENLFVIGGGNFSMDLLAFLQLLAVFNRVVLKPDGEMMKFYELPMNDNKKPHQSYWKLASL
jgi:hypothetical protein